MKIHERIKSLRKQMGMTQEELAKKTGYRNNSAIAKIEAGQRDLGESQIVAFAKALDTTPAYLMGWEDEQAEKTDAKHSMDELQKALMSQEAILFDGEPIDAETRDLLLISLRNTMELAEKLSKNRKG